MRATEYINPYATCGLISSVAMLRSDSVTMEFGYVKGWILCGSSWARYSSPTPFAFWQYMSGKYWCKTFPSLHPPSGGTATFQVSDTNSNAYWGSWYSGKELQPDGINLGVTGGYALVNMERESSTDGGGAHFYNATAYKYGGWTLFGGLQLLRDDDPDYDLIVVSTFEGKVARP